MAEMVSGRPEPAGEKLTAAPPGAWLAKFVSLLAQLGLMVLVIRQFQVESDAFFVVVLLACAGFAVHYFLPMQYRLPFFVLLSFTGIGTILGLTLGACLVGLGLVLIGICHLPVAFPVRLALLLLSGAVLAVMRLDWLQAPWSPALWPLLGSIFMFRLIGYLYDLRHDTAPVSGWRTLAYFFLLPNVCFMLFPVVDYKTFRRNYYNDEPHRIYQVGIDWMVRGIIHLLLYRLVYYHFVIAPSEVQNLGHLIQYMVANFLLYLRVSGHFHIIIGMLHLFGFHLPETHHYYFLASSFTDFWRRINIYWKDFMLKIFYYPVYFKLRTWGTTRALVAATLLVFVSTWFLHSYQWFWLRGSFLLSVPDVLFWGILAVFMVINSLYESKHSRQRSVARNPRTVGGLVPLALRTAGTFSIICILWSMWTSESLSEWLSLWTVVGESLAVDVSLLPALVGVAAVLFGGQAWRELKKDAKRPGRSQFQWHRSASTTIALLLLLACLGNQQVYSHLGSQAANVIHSLRSGFLNRVDAARHQRGYYEELLMVGFTTQLWEVYLQKPLHWLGLEGLGLTRPTGDFLHKELVPLAETTAYGVSTRINQWGMRDQEYTLQAAPHTYRMAILGASPVLGLGVGDHETFEALVEEHLNREKAWGAYAQYEILNFGVTGYRSLQKLAVLEKVWPFAPRSVLYVATKGEAAGAVRHLAETILTRVPIPYEYLREVAQRAKVDEGTAETTAIRRLTPWRDEILAWTYRRVVDECQSRGVLPLWMYLPMPKEGHVEDTERDLTQRAAEAGFLVLPMGDVYANQDEASISLAQWDYHPNARGHQLLAERLYEALRERAETIFRPSLAIQGKVERGPENVHR